MLEICIIAINVQKLTIFKFSILPKLTFELSGSRVEDSISVIRSTPPPQAASDKCLKDQFQFPASDYNFSYFQSDTYTHT